VPTDDIRVGLALSGGGVRAAVFHLGVLARLAHVERLEQVRFVSTVSGGSLVTALVYFLAGNRWPTSSAFLGSVLPAARERMTQSSLQRDTVIRSLRRPWLLLERRADVVAESLKHAWGIHGRLCDLLQEPRWMINATTYETGKNWRFEAKRMGDYTVGHVFDPPLPIAVAAAASAAFPGLIGPLVVRTGDYQWQKYEEDQITTVPIAPKYKVLHLWDGGVYDNLGVEALFKSNRDVRYRDGFNFLIVSDASGFLPDPKLSIYRRAKRLVEIPAEQVRGLRARDIVNHFRTSPGSGAYLRLGGTAESILTAAGIPADALERVVAACLPKGEVAQAAAEGTHLDRLRLDVFDRLCRHGWEVTDCTLHSRCPDLFSHQLWAC
jgi:NTE family protein